MRSYIPDLRFGRGAMALLVVALPVLTLGSVGCSDEPGTATKVDAADGVGDSVLSDSSDESDSSPDSLPGTDAIAKTDAAVGTDIKPECTSSAQCDDSNPCTTDICKASQICDHQFNSDPCDDGNPCTQNDTCELGSCAGTGNCQDTTTGTDETPGCDNVEWAATQGDTFIGFLQTCAQNCGTNANTQCIADCITTQTSAISSSCANCWGAATMCASQACLTDCIGGATSVDCKTCIAKSCGKALGTCAGQQAAVCGADADCDDNNTCTTDRCTATWQCENVQTTCDDNNPCTQDSCKSGQGCVATPLANAATCTDSDACTSGDVCLAGDCTGTAVNCDDGVDCTADACDVALGCGHTATDADCNDNNPCTTDVCDLSAGCTTTNLADATSCNDGLACTDNESCLAGLCVGNVKSCDDGVACTVDSCDNLAGCKHTAADSACEDDFSCTEDTCDAATGCKHVAQNLLCDDDVACTANACDAATGCKFTPDHSACADDAACTTNTCDPVDGCKTDFVNAACDDEVACTEDVCSALGCTNTPKDALCNDDIACTVDGCAVGLGCGHTATDALCNDDNACTTDVCGVAGCAHAKAAGLCHIGESCFAEGAANPVDACQVCDLSESATAFSAGNEGGACTMPGNTAGTCWFGTCTESLPVEFAALHDGKTCELPTCSTATTLPFDYSGNWVVTTTTVSTTCNNLVQTTDTRLQVGTVKSSSSAHPLNFAGACDFAPGGQTLQIGSLVSNHEVTCEAKPESDGVTSLELSQMTFANDGTATGTAKVILYDLPWYAFDADNMCEATFTVKLQRVPDCTTVDDCNDNLACTTDTCESWGACSHTVAPGSCAIDGVCYSDGDKLAATGNGSCSYCSGQAPSQHGWVVNQNGESCTTESGPGTCGVGGVCTAVD